MFPNGDASFNMQPQVQMGNAGMLFGQMPGLLPGSSNQVMAGQADSSSSQMFRPGLQQQQQMDPMMAGSNKNLQQEVILNLMKEYGNPEQIGSLFDQQMADPFNIQMQLPLMDYFD